MNASSHVPAEPRDGHSAGSTGRGVERGASGLTQVGLHGDANPSAQVACVGGCGVDESKLPFDSSSPGFGRKARDASNPAFLHAGSVSCTSVEVHKCSTRCVPIVRINSPYAFASVRYIGAPNRVERAGDGGGSTGGGVTAWGGWGGQPPGGRGVYIPA